MSISTPMSISQVHPSEDMDGLCFVFARRDCSPSEAFLSLCELCKMRTSIQV